MRILFLTSQYPFPPRGGGALRAYGLIQGVIDAGHTVHLFSFADYPPSPDEFSVRCAEVTTLPPPSRDLTDRLRDLLFSTQADMARRFWSEEALMHILDLLQQHRFDIIHTESIEMAAYLIPLHKQHPELPMIYGSLNAEADLQRTMFSIDRRNPKRFIGMIYSWIQWRRLTRLESAICNLSAYVLAVSESDRDILAKLTQTPIALVKNGIQMSLYITLPRTESLKSNALVFTGTMDYRPNVDAVLWFADAIFPYILEHYPDAHFYIVGHRPHQRLAPLYENPNITITGKVPEVLSYLQGATVYIAPLRMGSGTRFKILEAMAAHNAVVSTSLGAQGLGVTDGQELRLADVPLDFAAAILDLLDNPPHREQLGNAASQFVQDHFDWSVIVPHLLKVYEAIIKT